jgi:uncharacterized membrane protein
MTTTRLEAFSDGVIAIIITIMVLELRVPHETTWTALVGVSPVFVTYVLSFVLVGIYWNNHHHMFHLCTRTTGGILWANLHLLFWLSLMPFATGWMGENHFAALPTAVYGVDLLGCAIAYTLLQTIIIRSQGGGSALAAAVKGDVKGKLSIILYVAAIALAFVNEWIAYGLYVTVAVIWFVPDRRIERRLQTGDPEDAGRS